ncbi:MAG: hypothetical protein OER88_10005 [Planctomycetota bacterium]|nr:hypothetical protein [Planctomycetota bacterium]
MNEVWSWGRCLTLSGAIMVAAASFSPTTAMGRMTDGATVAFVLGIVSLVAGTGICWGALRESRRVD